MKKVLVINASARGQRSQSRKLTEIFTEHWKGKRTETEITNRQLGSADVPHVNENWIAAAFKPETTRTEDERKALETSDTYIAELHQADIIVLGTPMYNWSIPSALKAYIDQVVRVNETFRIDATNIQYPYIGLLENKTLFLLLSRGDQGYEKGGYNEHMNFQDPYLKTVFNIMGIHHIHVIAINGISYGPEKAQKSIELSHQELKDLIDLELKQQ
ncbi:NAD(P)H-dependent oxidoreductase [Mucilaginibacter sp.]|uniref:FMN-dependent NADH-azoreductase n=1 Tax=Mucilaginibacter sp. TaxID=1882438 RepID=UPI00263752B8|nr:NAD(P)H-dependent oxidoreductase [Mucilaginibacter sp.]MDB4921581.1 dehydrogenase [Mucilaginibacter sp.]